MNVYVVCDYDFTRTDGLIEVKLKSTPKIRTHIVGEFEQKKNSQIHNQIQIEQVISKIKCLKQDYKYFKDLLKRPYNIKEFKEFYRIYGRKLINIDFGRIELFNLKGKNQFSIAEINQLRKDQQFVRWGKIFSVDLLKKFKDCSTGQFQILGLQFYNMLVRERLFTLRTLRYYKNDIQRKQFPYQYLYIYDLEDCLQFNLKSFKDLQQVEMKQNIVYLPKLKLDFFQRYYDNFKLENIIVPFFQFLNDDDLNHNQIHIQLFFAHFNKNGYQIKNQRFIKQALQKIDEGIKPKCYIFINCDTSTYLESQLVNGVMLFAFIHNFEINQSEIKFININNSEKTFLEEYVDYIEAEFFQSPKSYKIATDYIFNVLPQELSQKSFNDILDHKFIVPNNVQNLLDEFFGK